MESIVHFEIPADNLDRAQRFYTTLFSWQVQAVPGMDYTMVTTTETDPKTQTPKKPGAINGGMFLRKGKETPVLVVSVPDVKKHVEKVKKAGGKIVQEVVPVGEMGLYAKFQDLEGNVLGLFQDLARKR